MDKGITNNRVAFDVKEEGESPPQGYTYMTAYMVFDVTLDAGFTQKEMFVPDRHNFKTLLSIMHALFVSGDSVWIVLMLADIIELDVKCASLHNAYINAKSKKRVWLRAGNEFGVHKGKLYVLVRELFDLKGYGSAWISAIRQLTRNIEFTPFRADGDVWMRMTVDSLNLGATTNDRSPVRERYYGYILIHVDGLTVAIRRADKYIQDIICIYQIKKYKKTCIPLYHRAYIYKPIFLNIEILRMIVTPFDMQSLATTI